MSDYVDISDAGKDAITAIAEHWSSRVDFTVTEEHALDRCILFVVDDICADETRVSPNILARLESASDRLHNRGKK